MPLSDQLLTKIKELLEANPFMKTEKLYEKFKTLNEDHLKKVLVMLYSANEELKKVGEDKVIAYHQKIAELLEENMKKATKTFRENLETDMHAKEEAEAEALLKDL